MNPLAAQSHFDFLIRDFGFARTSEKDPVRYDTATLYVEIWSGKGEIDLIFGVKIDTEAIRPFVSHVFSIAEIVRYYKTGPFPAFDSFSAVPELDKEERFLIYLASLTKKYCGDILRGDLTPLERLSQKRSAKHPGNT